jgi:hypothetical protein
MELCAEAVVNERHTDTATSFKIAMSIMSITSIGRRPRGDGRRWLIPNIVVVSPATLVVPLWRGCGSMGIVAGLDWAFPEGRSNSA